VQASVRRAHLRSGRAGRSLCSPARRGEQRASTAAPRERRGRWAGASVTEISCAGVAREALGLGGAGGWVLGPLAPHPLIADTLLSLIFVTWSRCFFAATLARVKT